MDRLPEELLDIVVAECDGVSLKQLRGTCRALARLATPHLFEHVHIGMLLDSLRKICCIAAHSDFRRMVKKLTYHGELLPYFESKDEYASRIDMRPPLPVFRLKYCCDKGLPVRALKENYRSYLEAAAAARAAWEDLPRLAPDLDLDAGYREYCSIWEEQQEWGEERTSILRQAICNLPNLKTAKVWTKWGDKNHGPVWGRLYPRILQGPDNWHEHDVALGMSLDGAQQTTHLLRALCERTNKPVRSLQFATSNNVFWCQAMRLPISHQSLWPEELGGLEVNARVYEMRHGFRNLTRLALFIEFDRWWDRRDLIGSGMRAFLQEARNLENLEFKYRQNGLADDGDTDFWHDPLHILGDVHWPRLHTLSVSFSSQETLFINLLKRHSATLKRLSLANIYLSSAHGSWGPIIEQIPHILRLEHVYFDALWDDDMHEDYYEIGFSTADKFYEHPQQTAFRKKLLDYCLRGGPFPERPSCSEFLQGLPVTPIYLS